MGTKTNQSGRSMIEMLGVLAIIGVLSVGGIAGCAEGTIDNLNRTGSIGVTLNNTVQNGGGFVVVSGGAYTTKTIELKSNQEIKYNNKDSRNRYIGQVLNGVPDGKGIMYFNNGDRYEGEWKNNIKEGRGIYYWNNGDIYEGDYKNGMIHES